MIGLAIHDAVMDRRPLLAALRETWAGHVDRTLEDMAATPGVPRSALLASFFEEPPSARVLALEGDEFEAVLLRQLSVQLRLWARRLIKRWSACFLGRVDPAAPDDRLRSVVQDLPPRPKLHRLLRELADELEEAPDRAGSLSVVRVKDEVVEVRWAPDRARLAHPTLFLDASADPAITRIFKPGAEFHTIDVERNTGRVVQIHDNRLARSGLKKPELVQRVQAALDHQLPRYAKPAIFLYKRDRDAGTFHLPEHAEVGHLGHVRGLNRWEGCDAVFVVGYLPAAETVERTATVLARIGKREVSLTGRWEEVLRGIRMRDGSGRGVWNRGHADPLAEAVLQQMQAEELVQAVDRIRAARAERPKDIYLLTSVVIDLTVDELVGLDDLAGTRCEQLLDRFGGVVPLNAAWLVERAPDLFPTTKTVEHWRERELGRERTPQTSVGTYSSLGVIPEPEGDPAPAGGRRPPLLEGTYRVANRRGRTSAFLVEADHPMPFTLLNHLVGEVAAYHGPPDRPDRLPVVRLPRVPLVTAAFAVGGRTFLREDPGLRHRARTVVVLSSSTHHMR